MAKAKPVGEFEYPEGLSAAKQDLVDQVLWALHLHGPFEDPDGRATAHLAEWLEEQGVSVPATLSGIVRDLATDDWGGYVERDCPATRTYSIGLATGIKPGKVPFPTNPFPDWDESEDAPVVKLVPLGSPDEAREVPEDVVAIALEITGLAARLVRELPTQITPQRDGLPDWVKVVLDENARLTEEIERLRLALDGEKAITDRLLPGRIEEPGNEVAASG